MKKVAGWIIASTLISYLLSVFVSPRFLALPTLLAWMILFLMWTELGKSGRNQAIILLVLGALALLFSSINGVFLGFSEVLAVNVPLLAMFVAVSFLTLTNSGNEDQDLPQGNLAVITTAFGTNMLGAVINLSILFVFGDRMKKNGTLSRSQTTILARSFCAAAWWSPFFIATGVALTYAPDMHWQQTLQPGILMCLLAICYSIIEVNIRRQKEFRGYPLKAESLMVPLLLAATVIVVHHFYHDLKILVLTCLVAPIGSLIFMKGRPRLSTLHDFINNRISSVSSQFVLFLAAGVFSTGLKSITYVYPAIFNLAGLSFTPVLFAIISGGLIIIGIIGVHPVVSIAIVSPLLLPLNPDHSQLGFLFLTSWAISTGCSPLSGVGLALTSRYHVSPRDILMNNWQYAVVMWVLACGVNSIFF
ncbi:hypothetical protein [Desulfopila aestuarii]|uniref:Citrate transporter n=1 Tax=Desulfopila aestuarii DSM 18488 TaxID=1121416 RepID=A0A1M7XY04_9BACT|nr:hypothetical protein [Desulfopila aestuarii]SHO43752.1 hypothetical protein SAMN02745220_00498 [Desulfopila aestuarii DSM 18488]